MLGRPPACRTFGEALPRLAPPDRTVANWPRLQAIHFHRGVTKSALPPIDLQDGETSLPPRCVDLPADPSLGALPPFDGQRDRTSPALLDGRFKED